MVTAEKGHSVRVAGAEAVTQKGFNVLTNSVISSETGYNSQCFLKLQFPDGKVVEDLWEYGNDSYEAFAKTFRKAVTDFNPDLNAVKLVKFKSKVGNDGKGTYANLTFVRGEEEWVSSVRAPGRYESFCQAYVQGFNQALKQ